MSISDLLFAFTEWLRTTPIVNLSLWISETKASLWIGNHFWAIPNMQNIHILSIAGSFGSVLMIDMRILGYTGKGRTMSQTIRRYMPWIWWCLLLLIVSGIGMIVGEPVRELVNPIFWIKMGLVLFAILVSAGFHASVHRNMARWEMSHDGRVAVRIGAVAVILLWFAIIFCGRWIAYAPV